MDLVKPSLAIAAQFGTGDDTGAASDADSTPSGRLVIEGTVDAASVTVSDDGTGDYEASVTIPASTANHGKGYQLQVSMTMGGITTPWVTVRDGQIVPANVYDSFAAGSDNLEVDTVSISGDSTAADNLEAVLDGDGGVRLSLDGIDFDTTGSGNTINFAGSGAGDGIAWDRSGSGDLFDDNSKSSILDAIADDATKIDVSELNAVVDDWINGGRLDLILDELTTQGDTNEGKIDTVDGIVDAILVDTGTTIPGNIQAAIDDISDVQGIVATVDTNVDAIKLVTDKLDDTLEDDGGTQRFTQNALEQAPSGGGGGDATLANQEILLARTAEGVTVATTYAADSKGNFSTPIVRGDAYNAAAGNAFVVSRATFPAAVWESGTTAVLKIDGTTTGTVAVTHDGTETITGTISLTVAQTEALTAAAVVGYEVEFINGTDQRTLYGKWSIRGSDEA